VAPVNRQQDERLAEAFRLSEDARCCVHAFLRSSMRAESWLGLFLSFLPRASIGAKGEALGRRGGPGCLNRFSASIGGASAGVRLPSGMAAQVPPPSVVDSHGERDPAID
jgi:hypothetical protein